VEFKWHTEYFIAETKQYNCLQTLSKHSQWWLITHRLHPPVNRRSVTDAGVSNRWGSFSDCRQTVWWHGKLVGGRRSESGLTHRDTAELWHQARWCSAFDKLRGSAHIRVTSEGMIEARCLMGWFNSLSNAVNPCIVHTWGLGTAENCHCSEV